MLTLKKKKLVVSVLSLALSLSALVGCGSSSNSSSDPAANAKLLKAIVIKTGANMFAHTAVTDSTYDSYFSQGTAAAGVAAIIANGKFYINGYAIPATAAECQANYPDGYLVNQVAWLTYSSTDETWTGGYKAQGTATSSYATAALAVADGIVSGLEVRLYDSSGSGKTDLIEADYKEGVQVDTITYNRDSKTYSVYRGDIDEANKTSSEGRTFDGSHFTSTSGETIKKADFDTTIQSGDVALFWYGPDGWAMQRAQEVNGIFVTGADHDSYEMDSAAYGDVTYADAMRFSRDNLFISNRPGEITNAQKYFGLTNNGEGLNVSLWLVPTTDWPTTYGAPVGLTSGSSAKTFLAEAIEQATVDLNSVVVSTAGDGSDVPTTEKWVTQAEYTQLEDAIARAKADMASSTSTNALLDYQIYILYLTLNGSGSDIGAAFGGYSYTGFMNEIQAGTYVAP